MSRIVSLTVSQSVSQLPNSAAGSCGTAATHKETMSYQKFRLHMGASLERDRPRLRWPSALALPSPLLLPFALPSPLAQLQQESDPGLQIDCT